MKKFKEMLALLMCMMMVLGCLAGCGSKEEPAAEEPAVTEESGSEETSEALPYEGVELVYWSMETEGTPGAEAINENVAAWEEKTGAKVEVVHYGTEVKDLIGAALAGGEKVDVFEGSSVIQLAANCAHMLDLTTMIEASDIKEKSYDIFWKEIASASDDGKLYGVAFTPSFNSFWYNKAIFEECGITETPKTIEEFEVACDEILAKGYQPIALDSAYVATNMGPHMERFAGEAALSEASLNGGWSENEDIVAGLQSIIDWVNKGYFAAGAPDEYPNSQNKMGLTEDVAMCYCGIWLPGEVEDLTGADLEWGCFNFPSNPDGKGTYGTSLSNSYRGINANCENPEAAWELIYFITTGDCEQNYADKAVVIPADPNCTPQPDFAEAIDLLKSTEKINYSGGMHTNADMKVAINEIMTGVYAGKYADGMAAAKALDALYN